MKSDLGQSQESRTLIFSGIFHESFLCVLERGYLNYLVGIFGHYCIEERNIKKRKLETNIFCFG